MKVTKESGESGSRRTRMVNKKQSVFGLVHFLPADVNYFTSEPEFLAVLWVLNNLNQYLIHKKFAIYTDHASVHWIITINDSSGMLILWVLSLA